MALEVSGKVVTILPEQTGSGKNGVWVKQDFVIETSEQFPKKICISAWGDKAAAAKNLSIGTPVKVAFNLESREFNGKWYTDIRAWKIESGAAQAPTSNSSVPPPGIEDEPFNSNIEGADDLPF